MGLTGNNLQDDAKVIYKLGAKRELFIDKRFVDYFEGDIEQRLHHPEPRNIVFNGDQPWEGNMCGGFKTVLKDRDHWRMYYQSWAVELDKKDKLPFKHPMYIGLLESEDAIVWRREHAGYIEFGGSADNNIVFAGLGERLHGIHGFSPFIDTKPGCPDCERYKAVGADEDSEKGGLWAMASPDGTHWELKGDKPIIEGPEFDSQNLAFWDKEHGLYRAYMRGYNEVRAICSSTSEDFVNWTKPEWLDYGDSPQTALYINQVQPYYRAPHLLIGFPARYIQHEWTPAVEALPEVEHRRLRSNTGLRHGTAVTDSLIMASRDGVNFTRWDEAFLRPGLRTEGNWAYGDNYIAWGMAETPGNLPGSPNELSLYATENYWRESSKIRRYALRIDGFVSLHAPLAGGAFVTPPFTFCGDRLTLNMSTSAAGCLKVEIQDARGKVIPGRSLDDSVIMFGDALNYTAMWKDGESDLSAHAGKTVRLRIELKDADLYSLCFI